MAEANKKNSLGIPATRGTFQMRGLVSGVDSNRFYSEKNTKTNKPRRTLTFMVRYDKDMRSFVELSGMEQKSVWYSKSEVDSTTGKRKTDTIEVAWRDRNDFNREGYSMIGTRMGLETVIDKDGNEKNEQKVLTPFDACEYGRDHLKDDMPVFVRGNITYNTYDGKHYKRFEPSQVSRCKTGPDFEAENPETVNDFTQRIIFMGVAPTEDKTRYVVSGKIVGYNSIEDVELFINKDRENLAKTLRKVMKPYYAIDVFGKIITKKNEEIVETTDSNGEDWGTPNPMDRNKTNNTETILVIMGADKESIDTDTYNEENVNNAIRIANDMKTVKKDFGDNDDTENDWGSGAKFNATDDEEEEW